MSILFGKKQIFFKKKYSDSIKTSVKGEYFHKEQELLYTLLVEALELIFTNSASVMP